MDSRAISGSCSCGNVSWTSSSPPQHLDFCYCLTCQKMGGGPFMAWMGIPKDSMNWTIKGGESFIYRSNVGDTDISVAERTCCGRCGSNVSLQYYLYPGKIHVAAATTDANSFEPLKAGCHIWTKHVPSWYTIPNDGVEKFDEFDDDFQNKLSEYMQMQRQQSSTAKDRGGWWAGLMPGGAPDYTSIAGPDTLTMADLWDDPSKVKRTV